MKMWVDYLAGGGGGGGKGMLAHPLKLLGGLFLRLCRVVRVLS